MKQTCMLARLEEQTVNKTRRANGEQNSAFAAAESGHHAEQKRAKIRTKIVTKRYYQKAAQAAVHVHADAMLKRQGRQLLDWVHTSVGVLLWLRLQCFSITAYHMI